MPPRLTARSVALAFTDVESVASRATSISALIVALQDHEQGCCPDQGHAG